MFKKKNIFKMTNLGQYGDSVHNGAWHQSDTRNLIPETHITKDNQL